MMQAGLPIAGAPVAGWPNIQSPLTLFALVGRQSVQPLTYLLEADSVAPPPSETIPAGTASAAVAGAPVAGPRQAVRLDADTRTRTLRWSDTGHTTHPNDLPAATPYPGRITSLVVQRSISLAPESMSDGDQNGDATLANADGRIDRQTARTAVHGHRVRILVGPRGGRRTRFLPIFDGIGMQWDTGHEARLSFADTAYLLDQPVQRKRYGGTGGADGSGAVKGRLLPLCFGCCENVEPVLIDPANHIYQVHDGPIQAVLAAYDGGVRYSPGGDATDLWSGTCPTASYRTDLGKGLIQLASEPAFGLTLDMRGDADPALGGYAGAIPRLVERILRQRMGFGNDRIDRASFAALTAAVPHEGGYYLTDDGTARQVMATLLRGIGAYWFGRRDRRIRVGRLEAPDPARAAFHLTRRHIIAIRSMGLPDALYPPPWRRTVGYRRNWTPMEMAQVDRDIPAERKQFLGGEWRKVSVENVAARNIWPRSKEPPLLESHLADEAGAQAVAGHLHTLHGRLREMFELTLPPIGHLIEMGDTIRVTWPGKGLEQGRTFIAFPVREDFVRREVTLVCWG